MRLPKAEAALPRAGPHHIDKSTPDASVAAGVTSTSILVSLDTILPISAANTVTTKTARGPPAPPSSLAALPTAISVKSTKGGQ